MQQRLSMSQTLRTRLLHFLGLQRIPRNLSLRLSTSYTFSYCTKQLISTQHPDALAYRYLVNEDPSQPPLVPEWGKTEADYPILRPLGSSRNGANAGAVPIPVAEFLSDERKLKVNGLTCLHIKILNELWVDKAVHNTLAFNFTASTCTATWQMLGQ
jgi:hypothetical protein